MIMDKQQNRQHQLLFLPVEASTQPNQKPKYDPDLNTTSNWGGHDQNQPAYYSPPPAQPPIQHQAYVMEPQNQPAYYSPPPAQSPIQQQVFMMGPQTSGFQHGWWPYCAACVLASPVDLLLYMRLTMLGRDMDWVTTMEQTLPPETLSSGLLSQSFLASYYVLSFSDLRSIRISRSAIIGTRCVWNLKNIMSYE